MQDVDLRNLMMTIQEKKQANANLELEFDCVIEVEDITPLVKVINYAINYISELSEQAMQISVNATMSNITLGFTTFTSKESFPPINPQAQDLLKQYSASLQLKSETGKYAQLLIVFTKFKERVVV
jgi:hypothetical protein